MRVALIGASGLLGRAVADALAGDPKFLVTGTAHTRPGPGRVPLDLTDAAAIASFFDAYRPQAVVLAAAERRPDVCEQFPEQAHALNVGAVERIAHAAREHGAWLLSISTDYVFDGSRAPYRPDAPPHPLNAYGHGKLAGERALTPSLDNACVLRLPLLYGPLEQVGESAATSFIPALEAARADRPAVVDDWAIRYPTFTPDVAVVIRQLLERVAAGRPVTGIHHWSGNEAMTKYAIALELAARLGLDPAHIRAQSTPADTTPRPYDCHLDSASLEALGIGRRTPFAQGLDAVLDELRIRKSA
ncbi:dTDP-4-dehydrorhamnose reductase family protein [Pararobbsia silviterrae]|uniref:dTDP-4-dehydrorhamnose reductase family protein n=1 Tax=Pararobbsia silviterrae TaxID=1792498 RepID=UPI001F0B97F5|nr:SDR family oxidoreductase [Pararobbsia silviterrae]